MTKLNDHPSGMRRTFEGLLMGAVWGLPCGLLLGLWRTFRSEYSWPWYLDIAGSVIVFAIGSALVCALGKGIANSVNGAINGAIAGGVIGILITPLTTELFFDYIADQSPLEVLVLGFACGAFPCALAGAVVGALLERAKRKV